MHVAPQKCRICEQRSDVVQDRLSLGVQCIPDRMLHPRVGGEDEQCRQHRAERHHPDARQVHPFGQPVPAEQPQPEEGRLQEERGQALHRQRAAEHVSDEPRVRRPVHPELELLHQSGDDPDRDIDEQQRSEEPRHPAVLRIARCDATPSAGSRPGTPDRSSPARTESDRCSSSRTASVQDRSPSGDEQSSPRVRGHHPERMMPGHGPPRSFRSPRCIQGRERAAVRRPPWQPS